MDYWFDVDVLLT